jgi:hypothetical protein
MQKMRAGSLAELVRLAEKLSIPWATGGGEGRELCKILRDPKKIVDASLKMKRAKGIIVGSTEATKVVEHEKRKPTLKQHKTDSLGNSKFVATVKYFLTYVYHLACKSLKIRSRFFALSFQQQP